MEPLEVALGKLSLETRNTLKAQFDASVLKDGELRPHFNRVYLHPEYMKKMNLGTLTPIIVSNERHDEVCALTWPSSNASIDKMIFSEELRRVFPVGELCPIFWTNLDVSLTTCPESVTICHKDTIDEAGRRRIQEFLISLKYLKAGKFSFPSEFTLQISGGSDSFALLTPKCKFIFKRNTSDEQKNNSYVDFPGQDRVKAELMNLYKSRTSANSQRLLELKIRPPKGVIIHGPPGVGKTVLAKRFCEDLGVFTVHVDGTDLGSKYFGESEKKIQQLFELAAMNKPSVIVVDQIESLCPKRTADSGSVENRLVASFLALIDGHDQASEDVFLVATASNISSLDSALRRPGRFDREVELQAPSVLDRICFMEKLSLAVKHDLGASDFESLSHRTAGFVLGDLILLVKEACLMIKDRRPLSMADFESALCVIGPSSLRDSVCEVPNVNWSDIAGLEETKLKLKESVEYPLRFPEKFLRLGLTPPKGVLLYGPPGCSKTLLAKAVASESNLNFMAIKGPEIFSKWVGDSEKAIQSVFKRARLSAPSVIFIDEIDSIASARGDSNSVTDRVLSQLLCEMDGIASLSQITVIAATNRPDTIDPALLRPGRFDRLVYVGLPDETTRLKIFDLQSKKYPFGANVSLEVLAKATHNYSGAEIVHICQDAAYQAMASNREDISEELFLSTIATIPPRISAEELRYFEDFSKSTSASN